jgi:hypothetical protein
MECLPQDRGGVLHRAPRADDPARAVIAPEALGATWFEVGAWSPARPPREAGSAGETAHTPHFNHEPLPA